MDGLPRDVVWDRSSRVFDVGEYYVRFAVEGGSRDSAQGRSVACV
jgi:hypothetical protein